MIGVSGMIIFGVCIFFQRSVDERPRFSKEGWIKVIISFGIFSLYVLMLKYIGYVISTLIILFIITTMFSKGKNVSITKRVIFSVIITFSIYLLFVKVLHVMLPAGVLF
jgi:dolichyl-phosphate-mannose--protein O-mannosyl transferase